MKALILAAGRGRRLGERSVERNKCMLPLAGKPLVQYSLENAARAGASEIVIVVGYHAEEIINEYGVRFEDVRVRYVIQDEPKGLVHAIECSRRAIDDSDFMLFLADEILHDPRHPEMMRRFEDEDLFVICGVVHEPRADEIRKTYAIIQNDADQRIYRLIEKPRNPPNQIRGTGNCIFRAGIFDYLEVTPINQNRREKELPDLIQCAIDDGHRVMSFEIGDSYININTPEDIATAESADAKQPTPRSTARASERGKRRR